MSNISVTGNEAQFNEKVTFLKDVEIKGILSVPETQELNLKKVITPDIEGSPNLQITGDSITVSGETTFLNQVNFQEALSFPNLEIRYSGEKKIKYNFKPKIGYYKSKKKILNRIKEFIKNYEK